jgi:hypothetical protein
MDLRDLSKSELEYSKKVLNSGLLGIHSGRQEFLEGQPLPGFLTASLRSAISPAAIGVGVGLLGSCSRRQRNTLGKALVFGLLGGAIGLGASFAWENRRLASSAAHQASRNMARIRDERWMKKHSIAYA